MTNEELVKEIQLGINVKRNMELLYTNNIKFMRFRIRHILNVTYVEEQEMEDLLQGAYFALDIAVKLFDSSRGTKFLTYFDYQIRNQLLRVDAKQSIYYEKRKPIRLDAPKSNDPEVDLVLIDTIEDKNAVKTLEIMEEDEYSIKLWEAAKEALIDPKIYEVLEKMHKEQMKKIKIMEDMKLNSYQLQELERKAYRRLKSSKIFKPYLIDSWVSEAYEKVSITSFRRTNSSSTERAALKKISAESNSMTNAFLVEIDRFINAFKANLKT